MATYDFLGIYVPQLLVAALIAAILCLLLARLLAWLGVYRHIWHPALFNVCLFIILTALLALPANMWWS
ncbi:DUF1656 domain-containing protein [Aquabacter cavernae]|uniref:DUF1656 domain-containing protein n=1 Tax=Aquabacter cavernae TaxID=2496029 RepID=UPI000F8F2231|nr:DUF1656 domain-containing protein [Aquabacter cavernae]